MISNYVLITGILNGFFYRKKNLRLIKTEPNFLKK